MKLSLRTRLSLLLPASLLVLVVLLIPVGRVMLSSFEDGGANYSEILATPIILRAYLTTLWLTILTVLVCLVLGYPLAYFLARLKPSRAALVLSLVLLPFWTNMAVKAFAFLLVLGRRGFINELLLGSGIIEEPLSMLFNTFSVVVGLAHIGLPLMILPLYATMRQIDGDLPRAAASLGAGSFRSFWEIFLPLSRPGISAGSILVFMTTIGAYVIPALLGSRAENMLAQFIVREVNVFFNVPLAAAITVTLLVLTAITLLLASRWVGIQRLFDTRGAAE